MRSLLLAACLLGACLGGPRRHDGDDSDSGDPWADGVVDVAASCSDPIAIQPSQACELCLSQDGSCEALDWKCADWEALAPAACDW